MPKRRDDKPIINPNVAAEGERFREWFRQGNRPSPSAEPTREENGPPFPKPTLEDVLLMPADTPERVSAKRAAASAWLRQFCERARYVLATRDLRIAARVKPECGGKIDQVRRWISAEEVEKILEGA